MTTPLRVAHYINQFFAGIGGEEQAGVGVSFRDGAVGPGRALATAFGDAATVVGTIVCGDNFAAEQPDDAQRAIASHLGDVKPDVLVAGPAFASGRYGLACAHACLTATRLGVPAVTAMHRDNPGATSFRKSVLIVPTGESAMSMPAALEHVTRLATKLGRREPLNPAEVEGYLPQGNRRVWDRGRPGWERALDMLLAKLHGRPFVTEVPYNAPEKVEPVSANATRYHRHSVRDLEQLTPEGWEAFHAGYFNHIVNRNPNYILPLSFLRDLEKHGRIGGVHEYMYALPGVSTPVAVATGLGQAIARDLSTAGVDGCLLVAT